MKNKNLCPLSKVGHQTTILEGKANRILLEKEISNPLFCTNTYSFKDAKDLKVQSSKDSLAASSKDDYYQYGKNRFFRSMILKLHKKNYSIFGFGFQDFIAFCDYLQN